MRQEVEEWMRQLTAEEVATTTAEEADLVINAHLSLLL
jgi:hypothetical protein